MDKHYGYFDGKNLKAGSLAALVKSEPANTPWEFTAKVCKNRKSIPQNGYLHVLFTVAANAMNEAGFGDGNKWTKDLVKYYCKQAGLYPIFDMTLPTGEVKQFAKDTRDLDKDEATETIDRVIRHFAEEHHIILPSPNEQMSLAA